MIAPTRSDSSPCRIVCCVADRVPVRAERTGTMKIGKWNVSLLSGGWGRSIRVGAGSPAQVREFDYDSLELLGHGIGVIEEYDARAMKEAARKFKESL